MISFTDFMQEEMAANSTGSVGVSADDVKNIGPKKRNYKVQTRGYIEVMGKRKKIMKEGYDKSSVAHNLAKPARGLGTTKFNGDGSAEITTRGKGAVSSTTMADHVLRSMSAHGIENNHSEKALKDHKQRGTHATLGKFSVHVKSNGQGSNSHTVTIK